MSRTLKTIFLLALVALGVGARVLFLEQTGGRPDSDEVLVGSESNNSAEFVVNETTRLLKRSEEQAIHDSTIQSELEILLSEEAAYSERLKVLNEIDWSALDLEQYKAIKLFLISDSASVNEPVSQFAIRNDLLLKLITNPDCISMAAQVLVGVVSDLKQHPLWREYVLQHYSIFIDDYHGDGLVDPFVLDRLCEILSSSLGEIENGMSGTAFLNLKRLERSNPEILRDIDYMELAARAAINPDVDLSTRISALGCLDPLDAEIRPEQLNRIMVDPEANIVLKAAALRYALAANNKTESGSYAFVLAAARAQNSQTLNRMLDDDW